MLVNIRVTKPNGEKIGLVEAILRSSVEIISSILIIFVQMVAIFSFGFEFNEFINLELYERSLYLSQFFPLWFGTAILVFNIWYWSELLVLLNKR